MLISVFSNQEAEDFLHHCIKDGEVIPSKHFRNELAKESVTYLDVWSVLRSGHIYDPPEQDIKTREWKYRIEGYEPDGKYLIIVFSFKTVDAAFLITIFSVEKRRKK